jgi:uncharacterized protein YbjT (DUF2867 family)
MRIIVTGSLGNIGKPLVLDLLQKGHDVTVISSNNERQNEIESLGVKAAIGPLEDAGFLASVFAGADALFAMVPPNYAAPDPIGHYITIGNSYAQAIKESGIKRVVQLSSWGAHLSKGTGVIVGSHNVEKIFNDIDGVSVTFLRPASFYNNLYHYTDMIKQAGFIATNYGEDDRVVMVSPRDIAAAAAEELVTIKDGKNIRYIASDERSCNDIAGTLGAAIGKPDLKWLRFTDEQAQQAMQKNGMQENVATLLTELNAAIRTGLIREDYDLHQPVFGNVKLEEFAKKFAKEFAGAFR